MSAYSDKLSAAVLDVARLDRALNKTGGYTTTEGVSVETWRDMLARQQTEFEDALPGLVDDATALAVASSLASGGPLAYFATYAALNASVSGLADGIYEILSDETHAGAATRYTVASGIATFQTYLEASDAGSALTPVASFDDVPAMIGRGAAALNEQAQMLANRTNSLRLAAGVRIDDEGDVDSDFAGALGSAIDKANEIGAWVVGTPGKTYYANGGVTIVDKDVRIKLNGAKILRNTVAADAPIITVNVSFSAPQAVTSIDSASIYIGASATPVSRISVSDSSGWAVGQMGRIVSDDLIPWDIADNNERQGESFRVALVETGYIYTYRPLRLNYSTNVRVARHGSSIVKIDDFKSGDEPGSPTTRHSPQVRINGAIRPTLERPSVVDALSEGIKFESCAEPQTRDAHFENLRTSASDSAYGYGVREEGCTDGFHIGISGSRLRHVYTTGAFGGLDDNDSRFNRYGGVIGARVKVGCAVETEHSAFDTHDDALGVVFELCSVINNYRGVQGGYYAIKLRGKSCMALHCDTYGPGAVYFATRENGGDHAAVSHVHVLPAGYSAVSAIGGIHNGSGRSKNRIDMKITANGHLGSLIDITKILLVGRLDLVWDYVAANPKAFSPTDSAIELDEFNADFSLASGDYSPRIAYFTDALSTFFAKRMSVTAGANPWWLADFNASGNYAASAIVGKLICDKAPGFASAVTNAGAGSVSHADIEVSAGVGAQPASMLNSFNSTSAIDVSLAERGEAQIVYAATLTAGGSSTKEFSFTTPPARQRQRLLVMNGAASVKTLTIVSTTAMPLGSSIVLAAGEIAEFIGINSTWVRAL